MNSGYISDGQEYFAELNKNNLAKFHTTFYGGASYRIVACSNITDHPMILKVMDAEKNILFNNKNHDYAPYWNLAFTSTVNCVIVIKVPANQPINKPVKLLIGFKDKPVDSNPIDTNLQ